MSLTSLQLIGLVAVGVFLYYTVCRKYQWQLLLVLSYIYYLASGAKNIIFIITTTVVTYLAAVFIEKSEQKNKKKILIAALFVDFGILAILKYTNFAIDIINNISGGNISFVNLLLPLGISFYTFQSTGYILDVYWKRTPAEKNIFKLALFVSYFPQIMQGPISRFNSLSDELFKKHTAKFEEIEKALILILYGLFKKMIIADNAAMYVNTIFNKYEQFDGLVIVGVLAYSLQLYGDFSGGIDVVRGISELFGVRLVENFKQPYFAKSITDFWHRWHITLGTWMKDYVFYPVTLSKWMGRFQKFAKRKFGKKLGRSLPICIANIIVFLVVGIWHGAACKYIVYGLYNGIIIGFSGIMADRYRAAKKKLNINDKSKGFVLFQIIRTFILVNISWLFDMSADVKQAFIMFKNMFTKFDWTPLFDGSIFADNPGYISYMDIQFIAIAIGIIVVFIISVLKEKKIDVAQKVVSLPWQVRGLMYLAVIFMLPMIGMPPDSVGGFIYAQF